MIIVVGGHSRNIGKTSVVEGLIRGLPQYEWTAIKITQFGHGVCSKDGEACACAVAPDHPFALTYETSATSVTDTARFLAAGARESVWLRARAGELAVAIPTLRRLLERAPDSVVESNSVMQFIQPDMYLAVLDGRVADFKPSARRHLDRVDAFLVTGSAEIAPDQVASRLLHSHPVFRLPLPNEPPARLIEWIESRRKVAVLPE